MLLCGHVVTALLLSAVVVDSFSFFDFHEELMLPASFGPGYGMKRKDKSSDSQGSVLRFLETTMERTAGQKKSLTPDIAATNPANTMAAVTSTTATSEAAKTVKPLSEISSTTTTLSSVKEAKVATGNPKEERKSKKRPKRFFLSDYEREFRATERDFESFERSFYDTYDGFESCCQRPKCSKEKSKKNYDPWFAMEDESANAFDEKKLKSDDAGQQDHWKTDYDSDDFSNFYSAHHHEHDSFEYNKKQNEKMAESNNVEGELKNMERDFESAGKQNVNHKMQYSMDVNGNFMGGLRLVKFQ